MTYFQKIIPDILNALGINSVRGNVQVIADELGVTRVALRNYLKEGRDPKFSDVITMCRRLNIDIEKAIRHPNNRIKHHGKQLEYFILGICGSTVDAISKELRKPNNKYVEDLFQKEKFDDKTLAYLKKNIYFELNEEVDYPEEVLVTETKESYENSIKITSYKSLSAAAGGFGFHDTILESDVASFHLEDRLPRSLNPYVAFEVSGDSMAPVMFDGDTLLCVKLEQNEWKNIKTHYVHVVVLRDEEMPIVKRLRINKRGSKVQSIDAMSHNRDYPDLNNISINDVKSIWTVKQRITSQFPHGDFFNTLERVEGDVSKILGIVSNN